MGGACIADGLRLIFTRVEWVDRGTGQRTHYVNKHAMPFPLKVVWCECVRGKWRDSAYGDFI